MALSFIIATLLFITSRAIQLPIGQRCSIKRTLKIRESVPCSIIRYCVEFEILKASKACRKEESYQNLKEGERVCVRCENEALRENLGWRCQGHGVEGKITRFSALSAPHCHGKWIRAAAELDRSCTNRSCKEKQSMFIFV